MHDLFLYKNIRVYFEQNLPKNTLILVLKKKLNLELLEFLNYYSFANIINDKLIAQ